VRPLTLAGAHYFRPGKSPASIPLEEEAVVEETAVVGLEIGCDVAFVGSAS
jgi:hypothetical protein